MRFPLLIGLRRSLRLDFILGIFHLVAAFSVGIALFPRDGLPFRLAGWLSLLLIALSAWRCWHRPMPERLRLTADGALSLHFSNAGGMRQAQILSGSVVSRHLAVLRLRIEDGAHGYPLTLLPDQMPAEQFRQLIVCLRWLLKADSMAAH